MKREQGNEKDNTVHLERIEETHEQKEQITESQD